MKLIDIIKENYVINGKKFLLDKSKGKEIPINCKYKAAGEKDYNVVTPIGNLLDIFLILSHVWMIKNLNLPLL